MRTNHDLAVRFELNLLFLVLGTLSSTFAAGFGLEAYNLRGGAEFSWAIAGGASSSILAIVFLLAYFVPRWRKNRF